MVEKNIDKKDILKKDIDKTEHIDEKQNEKKISSEEKQGSLPVKEAMVALIPSATLIVIFLIIIGIVAVIGLAIFNGFMDLQDDARYFIAIESNNTARAAILYSNINGASVGMNVAHFPPITNLFAFNQFGLKNYGKADKLIVAHTEVIRKLMRKNPISYSGDLIYAKDLIGYLEGTKQIPRKYRTGHKEDWEVRTDLLRAFVSKYRSTFTFAPTKDFKNVVVFYKSGEIKITPSNSLLDIVNILPVELVLG